MKCLLALDFGNMGLHEQLQNWNGLGRKYPNKAGLLICVILSDKLAKQKSSVKLSKDAIQRLAEGGGVQEIVEKHWAILGDALQCASDALPRNFAANVRIIVCNPRSSIQLGF